MDISHLIVLVIPAQLIVPLAKQQPPVPLALLAQTCLTDPALTAALLDISRVLGNARLAALTA